MYSNQVTDDYILNKKAYEVGIYVRLSREDDMKIGESESIQNQKEYCTNYVINQGWNIANYYCDDGFTGTNFDRPDFKRLINDIENGKINLVIVKDLSRLGRDYIETGYYIEKYFPKQSVRFIAINDGIDTFSNNTNNDMSPFKSVMNDMYAKDISKKVRSVMDTKRMNGQYIGAFGTYGYKKDSNNKNQLIIDEAVAPIVKRIFEMYSIGCGITKIANILNDEEILCPGAYKKQQYPTYNNPRVRLDLWTAHTIKYILNNYTYAGDLAQGKFVKVNYKVKKFKNVPKDRWIIAKDAVPAIVERNLFDNVQKLLADKKSANHSSTREEHLLVGLIFCGDCGERLTFTKTFNKTIYCICSQYKRFSRCSRHSIAESLLEKYVINDLKRIISLAVDEKSLLEAAQQKASKLCEDSSKNDAIRIENRLAEIMRTIKTLYEDKLRGILTEQDFVDLSKQYNEERERLYTSLQKINKQKSNIESNSNNTQQLISFIRDFTNLKKIDRVTILKLIDKIEVFDDKRIVIHYKFNNPFNK